MDQEIAASIVVATYNEGINLHLTLDAVNRTCDGVPYEVVVVDDGSDDGSVQFLLEGCEDYPNARVITTPRVGPAQARNAGANVARGRTVVFLDAHCFPKTGWLRSLVDAVLGDPRSFYTVCISTVGTPRLKGWGLTLTSREFDVRWLPRVSDSAYDVPIAGAACMAVDLETFFDIGGFYNFRTIGLEDVELCLRAWGYGLRVRVLPDVEVAHIFKQRWRENARWEDYLCNTLTLALLHLDDPKLSQSLERLSQWPGFHEAWRQLFSNGVWDSLPALRARRLNDFEAFCRRFAISW